MPTYINLSKFTQQGASTVKDFPRRFATNIEAGKARGVTVKDAYVTMGQYDLVVILEAPDDETAVESMLIAGQGNSRPETLRAFSMEEFEKIADRLP